MLEPPLAYESLAARLDLLSGSGINHVGVVRGDLLVQTLRRMRQQVSMLVDRTPLYRHAIPHGGDRLVEPGGALDDEELRLPQAAPDQIGEPGTPARWLTYLAGANTRRVRRALNALFGGAVGKDTVSRTWRKVKSDWARCARPRRSRCPCF